MSRPATPGIYWVRVHGVLRTVEVRANINVSHDLYFYMRNIRASPYLVSSTSHYIWVNCYLMPEYMLGCVGIGDVYA